MELLHVWLITLISKTIVDNKLTFNKNKIEIEWLYDKNTILEIAICCMKMGLKYSKQTHKTLCDHSKINRIKMFYHITVTFNKQLQISMQINGRGKKSFHH